MCEVIKIEPRTPNIDSYVISGFKLNEQAQVQQTVHVASLNDQAENIEIDNNNRLPENCPIITVSFMGLDDVPITARLVSPTIGLDLCLPGVKLRDSLLCRSLESHSYAFSSVTILQMLLWPSILFIGGFVGVVLTCIHMQHESVVASLPQQTLMLTRIIQPGLHLNNKPVDSHKHKHTTTTTTNTGGSNKNDYKHKSLPTSEEDD